MRLNHYTWSWLEKTGVKQAPSYTLVLRGVVAEVGHLTTQVWAHETALAVPQPQWHFPNDDTASIK